MAWLGLVFLLAGGMVHAQADDVLIPVKENGKWGYVNTSGSFEIRPRFSEAHYFSGDRAVVGLDGGLTYIDRGGEVVLDERYEMARNFYGGVALVKRSMRSWKFIHTDGEVIKEGTGLFTKPNVGGVALIRSGDGWTAHFFADDREVSLPSSIKMAQPYINGYSLAWTGDEWVALNREGSVEHRWSSDTSPEIIRHAFTEIDSWAPVRNSFAPAYPVRIDGEWGFINGRLKLSIQPKYDEALPYSEGRAGVKKGDNWFFIDRFGNRVFTKKFDDLTPFYRNWAGAKKEGKWGLINKDGDWVIRPTFQEIRSPLYSQSLKFEAP